MNELVEGTVVKGWLSPTWSRDSRHTGSTYGLKSLAESSLGRQIFWPALNCLKGRLELCTPKFFTSPERPDGDRVWLVEALGTRGSEAGLHPPREIPKPDYQSPEN